MKRPARTLPRSIKGASTLLKESHIEQTCTEWLALDKWRSFKMEQNFSERKLKQTGEAGMGDRLYIRYLARPCIGHGCSGAQCGPVAGVKAEVLWVEWKRIKGKKATKATKAQIDWHEFERCLGALTLIAGVDFPATIEGFQQWYRDSGLMRRAPLVSGVALGSRA